MDWSINIRDYLIPCPFKYLTGCNCPGCGIQRSIIEAFCGNLGESFTLHPAGIPIILISVFFILNLKMKFSNGNRIINIGLILIGIISIINWAIQAINQGSCCL